MLIKVFESFAGYGSQAMSLKRLQRDYDGIAFEFVGISEIDKNAIRAYRAVHGDVVNYGDITTIDWSQVPDFDLFTYSFPCQDISNAGRQRGLADGSGSRSSLLWQCEKAIRAKMPRYLLMENVKNLVSEKFMPDFQKWISLLTRLGYDSTWKVLNAKDYGIPQNRERVFMVSVLHADGFYHFPRTQRLDLRLKDVLEADVAECYYLRKEQVERIMEHCDRKVNEGCGFRTQFKDADDIATTVSTKYGQRETDTYLKEPRILQVGNLIRDDDAAFSNPQVGRIYSTDGLCPTLDTMGGGNREPKILACASRKRGEEHNIEFRSDVANAITTINTDSMIGISANTSYRIRKLTPRECFRLMDVSDADIDKIQKAGISKSAQYKLAGNSIVVACLYHIFRKMFVDTSCEDEQLSLF